MNKIRVVVAVYIVSNTVVALVGVHVLMVAESFKWG